MGKAVDTSRDNLGYFNPPNVYRPAIIDIRLVGEYSAEDGATNTYRITQNDGKIFEFDVKNGSGGSAGRSVTSVEQIQISTESLGKNIARINLSDGTYTDVEIRNGAQGQTGPQGERGPAGIDQVEATVDNAVGTPSVDTSVVDGKLHLDFHNMKGVQGEPAVGIENYVTVEATAQTTDATDVLPAIGSADTLYRVACWDGAQYDTTVYSVYGWYDGAYKFLEKKEVGIDDEPTTGSQNFVKSGGVAAKISQLGQKVEQTTEHSRNLADSASEMDGLYITGDGDISNNAATKSIKFPCLASTTYTISKVVTPHFRIAYYDAEPNAGVRGASVITDNSASHLTITTGANAKYIVAYVYNSNDTTISFADIMASLQIEVGSTATPYVAPGLSAIDKNIRAIIDPLSESVLEIKQAMEGEELAYLHNGLPMIDKNSSVLGNITDEGRTLTPRVLSNFLLDMHFIGTPQADCQYALIGFQFAKNGTASYANALYIYRINADESLTELYTAFIGKDAPSGIKKYEFNLSNDAGVTKCVLLLDWDALSEIENGAAQYSHFQLSINGYVFNQDYLFGSLGLLGQGQEIEQLGQEVEAISEEVVSHIDITIPPVVYAIVGTELNLWNDAISFSMDRGLASPLNYQVVWNCTKGFVTDRCFRYIPKAQDAGQSFGCTCSLYSIGGKIIKTKTFQIKVLAKDAVSSAKRIVVFGDSLGATTATSLYLCFNDSNKYSGVVPTMLGTRGTEVKYEAVGGYRWADYATSGTFAYRISVSGVTSVAVGAKYTMTIGGTPTTFTIREVNITDGAGNLLIEGNYGVQIPNFPTSGTLSLSSGAGDSTINYSDGFEESGNPLWNSTENKLDIALYRSRLGLSASEKLDAVVFQFGINDQYVPETLTGYIQDLYDAFIEDNPNCLFIISIPPTGGNDYNGLGANYGASGNGVAHCLKMYNIRNLYISLLQGRANLRISTAGMEVDRYYGYDFSLRDISQRFNGVDVKYPDDPTGSLGIITLHKYEAYHNNYVHPASSGYRQIGDGLLAAFTSALSE